MAHLNELIDSKQKRDSLMMEAAKLLDEAMAMEEAGIVVPNRVAMMEQIVALDADNAAGLRDKYEAMLTTAKMEGMMDDVRGAMQDEDGEAAMAIITEIRASGAELDPNVEAELSHYENLSMVMAGKIDEVMAKIDAEVDAAEGAEAKQQAAVGKVMLAMQAYDVDLLKSVLDEIVALAPDSELSQMVESDRERLITDLTERKTVRDAENAIDG